MVSQQVPYLPCYDGFRVIPANLIRELSRRHDVHLVAIANGTENPQQREWSRKYCCSTEILLIKPMSRLANRVTRFAQSLPNNVVNAVREHMRNLKPDVFHLEGPAVASLARLSPPGTFTLLSAHDSLSLRYRDFARFAGSFPKRTLYKLLALTSKRLETDYNRADRVIVTSRSDFNALSRYVAQERLSVIANGIDLDYWAYQPVPESGRLVFTGNMSWPPNEDAAEYFAVEVFPLVRQKVPEAEFWVVGADPSPKVQALGNIMGVNVTGTVPDIREWIWRASVYVSPLRFGAGVKNKILEAMALGAPIVATPKSLTGTSLIHGRHSLIAQTAPEIAEAVLKILGNDELRLSLSKNARRRVETDYSWESITARFEKLYVDGMNEQVRPYGLLV